MADNYVQERDGLFYAARLDQSGHINSADFPIGTAVEIVCGMQDFSYFKHERGIVTRNRHEYLGITVEFDRPRRFEDGYVQTDFNFEPGDLEIIQSAEVAQ